MTASIGKKHFFSTAHKLKGKPNWQAEPAKVVSTILYSKLFVSFSYCGVCYHQIELSISYVIVVQKSSSGDRKFAL